MKNNSLIKTNHLSLIHQSWVMWPTSIAKFLPPYLELYLFRYFLPSGRFMGSNAASEQKTIVVDHQRAELQSHHHTSTLKRYYWQIKFAMPPQWCQRLQSSVSCVASIEKDSRIRNLICSWQSHLTEWNLPAIAQVRYRKMAVQDRWGLFWFVHSATAGLCDSDLDPSQSVVSRALSQCRLCPIINAKSYNC